MSFFDMDVLHELCKFCTMILLHDSFLIIFNNIFFWSVNNIFGEYREKNSWNPIESKHGLILSRLNSI